VHPGQRCIHVGSRSIHPLYILYSSGTTGCQVHRARRRRYAAPTPERAPAAHRCEAADTVLLHDLRLDDVDWLASGLLPARRSSCMTAVRFIRMRVSCGVCGRRTGHHLRHQRQVYIAAMEKSSFGRLSRSICPRYDDTVDRIALYCLMASTTFIAREVRRSARVDLGWHGHRLLLCAGLPNAAGSSRRDQCRGLGMRVDNFR